MRKICVFANCHSSAGEVSGGDVRFREIFKRGKKFDKIIVTSKFGYDIYKKEIIKAKYFLTSKEKKKRNIFLAYFQRTLKSLFLDLKISECDILYSTSDFLPDVLPAFIWKLRNRNVKWVQVIHHLYENPLRRRGKNFLVNLLGFLSQQISFIMIKRKADLIITVNPLVKSQLIKLGFNTQKIKVNYNGVDLTKIRRIKPSDKRYDCAFLGRLNVSKGIFDLVEIWKIIVSRNPNVTLAIIGGGDESLKHVLKNKVKKCKLENNIDILGYLEDEQAFGILKSCKVFVFLSYEEGFGVAALEAMACGLPVVAWDLPTYHEVFSKGMVKVPLGDVGKFANEILRLLNDSQLYERMRNEAIEVASKYDWDKIAEKELEIMRRI